MTGEVVSSCSAQDETDTYVWRKDDRWRRLIQVCHMEGLALLAQVHRLEGVQTHLHLLRLLRWLLGLTSHVHLLELVRHTLHTRLSRWLIASLWLLIACLRCSVLRLAVWLLRLSVCWLLRLLHVGIAILRLLRHAIRRLLSLLTRIAIASRRRLALARVLCASRLLSS